MKYLIFLAFLFINTSFYATHERGGYITYSVSNNQYTFRIVTWTDAMSTPADRCELTLWIDGGIDSLVCTRVNGTGPCPNGGNGVDGVLIVPAITQNGYGGIKENIYVGGPISLLPGQHVFTVIDPNRDAGILNLGTNSNNIAFAITDTLYLYNNTNLGMINNAPVIGYAPIDISSPGQSFVYNPAIYDTDQDSLVFSLLLPHMDDANNPPAGIISIPNAFMPAGISIDGFTGKITWNPVVTIQGEYEVTIRICEYRRSSYPNCNTWYKIGVTYFDVQLLVWANQYCPISYTTPSASTCVAVGSTYSVQTTAVSSNCSMYGMYAAGAPLTNSNIGNNATLIPTLLTSNTVSATFSWTPSWQALSNFPYQVVIKAFDGNFPDHANYQHLLVRVISPAPTNVIAFGGSGQALLTWSPPAGYSQTGGIILQDYLIYRIDSCLTFTPSGCQTGAPPGFTLVGSTQGSSTSFTDYNVPPGPHSYLVVAHFSDCSESIASSSSCAIIGLEENYLEKDIIIKPVPAHEIIYIEMDKNYSDKIGIELINSLGITVTKTISNADPSIDVSELSPGVYFVIIKIGEKARTKKIVIE